MVMPVPIGESVLVATQVRAARADPEVGHRSPDVERRQNLDGGGLFPDRGHEAKGAISLRRAG